MTDLATWAKTHQKPLMIAGAAGVAGVALIAGRANAADETEPVEPGEGYGAAAPYSYYPGTGGSFGGIDTTAGDLYGDLQPELEQINDGLADLGEALDGLPEEIGANLPGRGNGGRGGKGPKPRPPRPGGRGGKGGRGGRGNGPRHGGNHGPKKPPKKGGPRPGHPGGKNGGRPVVKGGGKGPGPRFGWDGHGLASIGVKVPKWKAGYTNNGGRTNPGATAPAATPRKAAPVKAAAQFRARKK